MQSYQPSGTRYQPESLPFPASRTLRACVPSSLRAFPAKIPKTRHTKCGTLGNLPINPPRPRREPKMANYRCHHIGHLGYLPRSQHTMHATQSRAVRATGCLTLSVACLSEFLEIYEIVVSFPPHRGYTLTGWIAEPGCTRQFVSPAPPRMPPHLFGRNFGRFQTRS